MICTFPKYCWDAMKVIFLIGIIKRFLSLVISKNYMTFINAYEYSSDMENIMISLKFSFFQRPVFLIVSH